MALSLVNAIDAVTNGQDGDASWANSVQLLLNQVRTYLLNFQTQLVDKTVDESLANSITLQADDELFLPVTASARYVLTAQILYVASATPNWKMGWTFPTGTTMSYSAHGYNISGSLSNPHVDQTTVPGFQGGGHGAINNIDTVQIAGLVTVSSTAGNLALTWAQNTSNASAVTTKVGSYIQLNRIV